MFHIRNHVGLHLSDTGMESIRRFVIGDIHGANAALAQCFERSGFNIHTDLLICLGDYCDRWPEVNKVFDTLLTVKNQVLLLGNHDHWAMDWFLYNKAPEIWLIQGGDDNCKCLSGGSA